MKTGNTLHQGSISNSSRKKERGGAQRMSSSDPL